MAATISDSRCSIKGSEAEIDSLCMTKCVLWGGGEPGGNGTEVVSACTGVSPSGDNEIGDVGGVCDVDLFLTDLDPFILKYTPGGQNLILRDLRPVDFFGLKRPCPTATGALSSRT